MYSLQQKEVSQMEKVPSGASQGRMTFGETEIGRI
jgi:hypothetical protein